MNNVVNLRACWTPPCHQLRHFARWSFLFLALLLVPASSVFAGFASWNSTSSATIGTATITLNGLTSGPELSLSDFDLTTPPYAAAPGSALQQSLNYLGFDDWSASSTQPLSAVRLYLILWRGDGAGIDPVRYTFDHSFSILSGLSGGTISGNTLILPAGDLYEGILQFTGTFSSLSVTSNAPNDPQSGSAQAMTFSAVPVPEPAGWVLALAAAGALFVVHNRRGIRTICRGA